MSAVIRSNGTQCNPQAFCLWFFIGFLLIFSRISFSVQVIWCESDELDWTTFSDWIWAILMSFFLCFSTFLRLLSVDSWFALISLPFRFERCRLCAFEPDAFRWVKFNDFRIIIDLPLRSSWWHMMNENENGNASGSVGKDEWKSIDDPLSFFQHRRHRHSRPSFLSCISTATTSSLISAIPSRSHKFRVNFIRFEQQSRIHTHTESSSDRSLRKSQSKIITIFRCCVSACHLIVIVFVGCDGLPNFCRNNLRNRSIDGK